MLPRWHSCLSMRETRVRSLLLEHPLDEGMATHSSILAWRILQAEEPSGLQSEGSHRVVHNWRDVACTHVPLIYAADIYMCLYTHTYNLFLVHHSSFSNFIFVSNISLYFPSESTSVVKLSFVWKWICLPLLFWTFLPFSKGREIIWSFLSQLKILIWFFFFVTLLFREAGSFSKTCSVLGNLPFLSGFIMSFFGCSPVCSMCQGAFFSYFY